MSSTLYVPPQPVWWKEAVIYQIYPASFLSTSSTSSRGDIRGIISKLDYIASLNVNAIWLSPIFKSPQKDMGYDISDYRQIHAPYGSVADVDELIIGCHERGIRVLLDLVVNHSSDQHAWFQESRTSKSSAKRDWYFWRDAKYDSTGTRKPPNNWASVFGGSAWHWDELSQQYYLALFLPSQPDLNWEHDDMRKATYDDMRFWLDKGVDGFRIDSMNLMSKVTSLPDAPITDPSSEWQSGAKYFASGPRMHEYIQEMRREVFDKYERCMTVGELGFTKDAESVRKYVDPKRHELNCLFAGDIVDMDFGSTHKYGKGEFKLETLKQITRGWQKLMPTFDGWNTIYMDNHDSGRSLSRYGSDKPEFRARAAKMLAIHLCTLSGSLFLLQGQEIGMTNCPRDWGIEEYVDVEARNYYFKILAERGGAGADMSDVLVEMQKKARDNGRLPMQWDGTPNAGFSIAKPWMRVNDDYAEWNVMAQEGKEDSVLSFWRQMLDMRRSEKDVFIYGRWTEIKESRTGQNVFAYTMTSQTGRTALILLNFSEHRNSFAVEEFLGWKRLVGDNTVDVLGENSVALEGYEGVIYCDWL